MIRFMTNVQSINTFFGTLVILDKRIKATSFYSFYRIDIECMPLPYLCTESHTLYGVDSVLLIQRFQVDTVVKGGQCREMTCATRSLQGHVALLKACKNNKHY